MTAKLECEMMKKYHVSDIESNEEKDNIHCNVITEKTIKFGLKVKHRHTVNVSMDDKASK